MGIDIRTPGVTGIPVRAIADGYVSRIKVRPGGYGKALYLTLADGRTAVYAHLESFASPVQKYVLERQWSERRFSQDLYPEPGRFEFTQGQVVCYSGQSGTKHPHLHFEIRREAWAYNPFTQGLTLGDNKRPTLRGAALIPLDNESEVDGDCRPAVYPAVAGRGGRYQLRERPGVYGRVGFAIKCQDWSDGAPQALSAYRTTLILDGEERFTVQIDSCDYYRNLMMDLDRDPYLRRLGAGKYQRLYVAPGNAMPFYRGEGIIDTREMASGAYNFIIRCADYFGNESELRGAFLALDSPEMTFPIEANPFDTQWAADGSVSTTHTRHTLDFFQDYFRVEIDSTFPALLWRVGGGAIVTYTLQGGRNRIRLRPPPGSSGFTYICSPDMEVLESWRYYPITPEEGGTALSPDNYFKVTFPPGGVYDTLVVSVQQSAVSALPGGYEYASSYEYRFEPQWVPLRRSAELVWFGASPDTSSGIFFFDKGEPALLSDSRSAGEVRGSCLNLETFVMIYDRRPPSVQLVKPESGAVLKVRRPEFRFAVLDELSGVDDETIVVTVDGEWALAEYDPPRDAVYVSLREPLNSGEHRVHISVSDKMGNTSEKEYRFTVR